jgi:hypothetical protein
LALAAAVLTVPLVIMVIALIPPLMVCPFLSERHQRLALRVVACLREWPEEIASVVRGNTS